MDALVLAGGETSPELMRATSATERALIEIGGRAMVLRVLETLHQTPQIARIAVVGSEHVLDLCAEHFPDLVRVPAGEKMTQNFARGVNVLKHKKIAHDMRASVGFTSPQTNASQAHSSQAHSSQARFEQAPTSSAIEQILVCTCDIPLVSSRTFADFIEATREKNLELAYPIVRRGVSEAAFPHGKRTYAKLADGEFTGGNAVVLPVRIVGNLHKLLETAYNARKNPLGLAKMLGPNLMWKFARKNLSIRDVETRAQRVLDCRVGAIQMTDATISFDVDKADDWRNAVRYLEKKSL